MYKKLLKNHTLTNLAYVLVLAMGWISYYQLPREQDPSVNFNWIQVITVWPNASATDIEKRVTEPLEEGIEKVSDIKNVTSMSRTGVSNIMINFDDSLDDDEFENRISDLRREIQNNRDQLPNEADNPEIIEITSSNAFPTATMVVVGRNYDESLRKAAYNIKKDLERITEVDRVDNIGDTDPEIQVFFHPERLVGLGFSSVQLANTVHAYFTDLAAGKLRFGGQEWLLRLVGTSEEPSYLERLPIITAGGEIPLRSVAEVKMSYGEPLELVNYNKQPAIMLSVAKKDKANNLELIGKIRSYIEEKNKLFGSAGVNLVLLDDQTESTRDAINVMERNAIIGLGLVLLVTWIFLGLKIAFFASLGIPFVIGGTFWALSLLGETLNTTVLLGVLISLGMLVDDAIVVVEAIYYRLQQGVESFNAAVGALEEVLAPVASAVFTTIAVFLPLVLMPGVLGDFMRVVPIVVSMALLISLIEAIWFLPSHIIEGKPDISRESKTQRIRNLITSKIRLYVGKALVRVLRKPKIGFTSIGILFILGVGMLVSGFVKVDYFASDLFRLFYINVEMPPGTSIEKTIQTMQKIETRVRDVIPPQELRSLTIYAGKNFGETEPLFGNEKGQLFVSLNRDNESNQNINDLIESIRPEIMEVPGPLKVSFLKRKTGPPTLKPINVIVRGDRVEEIRLAVDALKSIMSDIPGIKDIVDDDTRGGTQMLLHLNADTITRTNLDPSDVIRVLRLHLDGEVVASMQYQGEKIGVRVRAMPNITQDVNSFLNNTISLPDGGQVSLGALLEHETVEATNNIRHYDLRRAITIEADIDNTVTDTVNANILIEDKWQEIARGFPGIDIKLLGELEHVEDSLESMAFLFLLGIGLVYAILGTQFHSYIQPILILTAVPTAFIGVVFGLALSGNPLSLYTLYGLIALAGISANDAIVLVSRINENIEIGHNLAYAVVSAARRRVVPIIITSLTTMAGLFSLATGLGGESLIWGPVATAIVWGLGVSTLLTLFFVPMLYITLTRTKRADLNEISSPPFSGEIKQGPLRQYLHNISATLFSNQAERWMTVQAGEIEDGHRGLYNKGVESFGRGDIESAIKCFQQLADDNNSNMYFNLCAAQSLVRYMQLHGWDIGYIARAKRYISRAKYLQPETSQIINLERICNQIDASSRNDSA